MIYTLQCINIRKVLSIGCICLYLLSISGCSKIFERRPSFPNDRVLFSPDGSKIVFAAYGDIFVMELDKGVVRCLTDVTQYEGCPAFSPDGEKIIYTARTKDGRGQIWVMNADGSNPKRLTKNKYYDFMPSFSPDGSKVVFSRAHLRRAGHMGGYTWDYKDIYLMNADGTGQRRLTNCNYYRLSAPYFSPDGRYIVYAAEGELKNPQSDEMEIYLIDLKTLSEPRKLTQGVHGGQPSFSPDGKKIVFVSDRAERYNCQIWIMNADGTQPRQVSEIPSRWNFMPTFSPDGKKILFLSDPEYDDVADLWLMDLDSGRLKHIGGRELIYKFIHKPYYDR